MHILDDRGEPISCNNNLEQETWCILLEVFEEEKKKSRVKIFKKTSTRYEYEYDLPVFTSGFMQRFVVIGGLVFVGLKLV